jgi:hypothetical protein
MTAHRLHRRFTSAFAALALLVSALLPGWTSAFVPRGDAWTEVCTMQGVQRVALPLAADAQAPADLGVPHLMDHCPCCPGGHGGMAPPAVTPGLPERPAPVRPHVPPAFLQAPATAHVWVTASPRAPPRTGHA